ncbi:MAG: hypothetical protein MJ252_08205 [archaeon]|nr:hypothetical protein [archaeon]
MENKLIISEDTQKKIKKITKEIEAKMVSHNKAKDMAGIFMIFYIILNESYYSLTQEGVIKYFIYVILKKNNIPSLSKNALFIILF